MRQVGRRFLPEAVKRGRKGNRMYLKRLLACAAAVAALATPTSALAGGDVNTNGLRHAVKPEAVFGHQAELEAIADANGSTRHTTTPDTRRPWTTWSSKLESYGYEPVITQFNHARVGREQRRLCSARSDVEPDKFYVPGPRPRIRQPGRRLHQLPALGVGRSDRRAGRAHDRRQIPSPGWRHQRLRGGGLPGRGRGAVALLQRGTCPFVQKLENAETPGPRARSSSTRATRPSAMNAISVAGPVGHRDPGRSLELHGRQGALRRLQRR